MQNCKSGEQQNQTPHPVFKNQILSDLLTGTPKEKIAASINSHPVREEHRPALFIYLGSLLLKANPEDGLNPAEEGIKVDHLLMSHSSLSILETEIRHAIRGGITYEAAKNMIIGQKGVPEDEKKRCLEILSRITL